LVYNEFFRAPDFEDPVDLDSEKMQTRKWEKDYFTSALPSLQRGTAPSLSLSGNARAVFSGTAYQLQPSATVPIEGYYAPGTGIWFRARLFVS
jgi:hypothetical protein